MNRNISRPHNFSRWFSSSVSAENGLLANRALLPTDFSTESSAIDEYFNDDEEFGVLTHHDELLLRMLYHDSLRCGMSAGTVDDYVEALARTVLSTG